MQAVIAVLWGYAAGIALIVVYYLMYRYFLKDRLYTEVRLNHWLIGYVHFTNRYITQHRIHIGPFILQLNLLNEIVPEPVAPRRKYKPRGKSKR